MEPRINKSKKKKKRKIALLICIPLLLAFLAVTGYGAYLYWKASAAVGSSHSELNRGNKSSLRDAVVNPIEDNVSILIMGVDESEKRSQQYGSSVRTDALILATFNKDNDSVKLVSIPRDTYTYIDVEGKYDKINHAHAFGGVDATVTAVENLLEVPVDYYVKINFEAFLDIVDTLGGIEVDVPITFTEQDSNDVAGAISLEKGLQTLNGEEALALARTRKIDSDLERGKRQQLVIESIIKKALSVSSITKYDNLIDTVGDNLTTNLTFDNIVSFLSYSTKVANISIESLQLKGEDSYIDGIYYYQLDEIALSETKTTLYNHLHNIETTDSTDQTDAASEE